MNLVKTYIWPLVWLTIFATTFTWRIQNLDAFGLTNDEGAYLMWTQLPLDGYPLYEQTRAVQPPLFFEWVGLFLRVGGPTVEVGRWSTLTSYVILGLITSWLAYRASGWVGANIVALLLGIAPLIFQMSRLVMAEIPATALAVGALALMFVYLDRKGAGWLVGSGILFGASMLIKALNPFIAVPIGLILLWDADIFRNFPEQWLSLLVNGLWWGAGVFVPIIVVLLAYDTSALIDQTITFRGDLRSAIPGSWAETWGHFSLLIQQHWGIWLLAAGSLLTLILQIYGRHFFSDGQQTTNEKSTSLVQAAWLYTLIWLSWLLAGIALLAWHRPLFYHHLSVLLVPAVLLCGKFVADIIAFWRGEFFSNLNADDRSVTLSPISMSRRILFMYGPVGGLSLLLLFSLFHLPTMAETNQAQLEIVTGGREAQAMSFVQDISNPNDFLMGDSQLLIYMAERRTPPPLGDVALVAVKAGRQTSERMIALTEDYQASAVVQWSLRLPWLPDYLAWVEENYLAQRVWDNDHIIYYVPRYQSDQALPNEQETRLGEDVVFRGYDLDERSVNAGQAWNLKLYWQLEQVIEQDYTVFLQLLDGSGQLVASWDSQPLGGHFPTSQWPANEIITDVMRLPISSKLTPGDYRLIAGMYLLETGERLRLADGQDFLTLRTITYGDEF